jgi:hypothetical protein
VVVFESLRKTLEPLIGKQPNTVAAVVSRVQFTHAHAQQWIIDVMVRLKQALQSNAIGPVCVECRSTCCRVSY